jgi:hypothetical protein
MRPRKAKLVLTEKICANCKFFSPNYEPTPEEGEEPQFDPTETAGDCRRHAPTVNLAADDYQVWPINLGSDWCGDFRALSLDEIRWFDDTPDEDVGGFAQERKR